MKRVVMAGIAIGLAMVVQLSLAAASTAPAKSGSGYTLSGHHPHNKPLPVHVTHAKQPTSKALSVRPRHRIAATLPPEVYYPANVAFRGEEDDGSWGPFPIGFSFPFFDSTYSEFYITSNGFLAFDSAGLEIVDGSGWSDYNNTSLPDPETPNGMICAFWNDIIVHANGGVIYYQTIGEAPNRKLVVQCTNMGKFGEPTLLGTFLFILYETSNEIQVQYRIIVDNSSEWAHGSEATIGIENASGTQAVEYSDGVPSITSEQAIRFIPDGDGSYTIDSTALYDGILLGEGHPPSIPGLMTPAQLSTVSTMPTFQWTPCDYTTSYEFRLATLSDLSDASVTDVGTATSFTPADPLDPQTTYYWAVFSIGDSGTTWSEIREFSTSDNPPPTATPQTVWTTLGSYAGITLAGTGGAGHLTAAITTLPANGELFQYDNGSRGAAISTVPTDLSDAGGQVIFYINDGTIGTNRGNFEFVVRDTNAWESDPATVTINVYPAPTVQTKPVIVTDSTSATGGGDVILDGGSTVLARGVCWGTTPNPTVGGNHTSDSSGLGVFASAVSGLTPMTPYYLRAYAQNASGIGYGQQVSFVAGGPQLTTDSVSAIHPEDAHFWGTILGTGGSPLVSRGFCFAAGHTPTAEDGVVFLTEGDTGSFNAYAYKLDHGTTYRLRAFATNGVGLVYGNEITFSTPQPVLVQIAGHVLDGDSKGIDSVVLGGLPGDPMTDSTGYYSAKVDSGWSGTIIPTRSSYTFVPDSIVLVSIDSNLSNQDFVGTSILSSVGGDHSGNIPKTYSLGQNYPNPFNPTTEIEFGLPKASQVSLTIYNVMGGEVVRLVNRYASAGRFHVTWNGTDASGRTVSTGIYLYRITAGEFTRTRKMLLLK